MTRPVQPGDIFLLREVRGCLGTPLPGDITTPERALEAAVALAEHPLTESELELAFGPNWRAVAAIVRQTAVLTKRQAVDLAAVWHATKAAARDTAWSAAATTATVAWTPAWASAWHAARAAGPAVRDAAGDATLAVTTRHVISATRYTAEHYDTLVHPWLSVMGDPFELAGAS